MPQNKSMKITTHQAGIKSSSMHYLLGFLSADISEERWNEALLATLKWQNEG